MPHFVPTECIWLYISASHHVTHSSPGLFGQFSVTLRKKKLTNLLSASDSRCDRDWGRDREGPWTLGIFYSSSSAFEGDIGQLYTKDLSQPVNNHLKSIMSEKIQDALCSICKKVPSWHYTAMHVSGLSCLSSVQCLPVSAVCSLAGVCLLTGRLWLWSHRSRWGRACTVQYNCTHGDHCTAVLCTHCTLLSSQTHPRLCHHRSAMQKSSDLILTSGLSSWSVSWLMIWILTVKTIKKTRTAIDNTLPCVSCSLCQHSLSVYLRPRKWSGSLIHKIFAERD